MSWVLLWFPAFADSNNAVVIWDPLEYGREARFKAIKLLLDPMRVTPTTFISNDSAQPALVDWVLFDARDKESDKVQRTRQKRMVTMTGPACAWMLGYLLSLGISDLQKVSGTSLSAFPGGTSMILDHISPIVPVRGAWITSLQNWLVLAKMYIVYSQSVVR
jgi:hypothetical protein